nr:TRAP transporter large permease subunit [Halomonas sp. LBP4]
MEPYGYNRGLAIGALAAGSMLGIMIPPSIALLIYAILTEHSVGNMFMAGLVPGLMGLKPLLTVAGEPIAGKEKLALSAVVFFMLVGAEILGYFISVSRISFRSATCSFALTWPR